MPYQHNDRPFTIAEALRVQTECLDRWETILKPEVFEEVREETMATNATETNPLDIVRGDLITRIVNKHRYGRYRDAFVEIQFERFSFDIPKQAAREMSGQGDSTSAVEYHHRNLRDRLRHISDLDMVAELQEYGAYDTFDDRPTNEQRLLWIGSCNAKEEGNL